MSSESIAVSPVSILFQNTTFPTGVRGIPGSGTSHTSSRYESKVSLGGGLSGHFRGSIYPDDMNAKGRRLNGTYGVFLGFHKHGTPTTEDLKVRTN